MMDDEKYRNIERSLALIESSVNLTKGRLDVISTLHAASVYDHECKACNEVIPMQGTQLFPLCIDCLQAIKELSQSRNKWVFK